MPTVMAHRNISVPKVGSGAFLHQDAEVLTLAEYAIPSQA